MDAIGIMVASYASLRCISFAARRGERAEHGIARGLAIVVLLIQMFCTFALLASTARPG